MLKGQVRILASRDCINCSDSYIPTSPVQKYCPVCQEKCYKESARKRKKVWYYSNQELAIRKSSLYKTKERVENTLKALYSGAKQRAKSENIEFSIALEELQSICPNVCPVFKTMFIIKTPFAMSLDRIDSVKGYVSGNVQIISRKANTMKNNASANELKMFADWIYNQ